jgi:DNA-binding MarR family transcriptional regulator
MSCDGVDFGPAAQLRAALRRFAHSTERLTRAHGLSPRRYELLLFIQSADQSSSPATITALCEPLQTTQGSVTQLVGSAVRAGLVRKTATPGDKRSHHLHLTPDGAARLLAAHEALEGERDRLADIIDQHLLST